MIDYKVTKGEVVVKNITTNNGDFYRVTVDNGESICNVTTRDPERSLGNANLIADAFNVLNKSGKTPVQLLKQNSDLAEWASDIIESFGESTKIVFITEIQRLKDILSECSQNN